ncbi:18799_t:CDS:2 [Acaulospora morrowiae]|uniref:18799_t:CDS:1 n=1 Tax=Acaulospora morrowiae TaxID=94023 RepID=A0A9N9DEI7_9GLOM|nr:18799_t:CDS:2 [Acaulospora morrowiae]
MIAKKQDVAVMKKSLMICENQEKIDRKKGLIKEVSIKPDLSIELYPDVPDFAEQPIIPHRYKITEKLMTLRPDTMGIRLRVNAVILVNSNMCVVANITRTGRIKRNMELNSKNKWNCKTETSVTHGLTVMRAMKDIIVHEGLDIETINGMACQFQINNHNKDIGVSKQTIHPGCRNPDTLHDEGQEAKECNIKSRPASMQSQIDCTANPTSIISPSNTLSSQVMTSKH